MTIAVYHSINNKTFSMSDEDLPVGLQSDPDIADEHRDDIVAIHYGYEQTFKLFPRFCGHTNLLAETDKGNLIILRAGPMQTPTNEKFKKYYGADGLFTVAQRTLSNPIAEKLASKFDVFKPTNFERCVATVYELPDNFKGGADNNALSGDQAWATRADLGSFLAIKQGKGIEGLAVPDYYKIKLLTDNGNTAQNIFNKGLEIGRLVNASEVGYAGVPSRDESRGKSGSRINSHTYPEYVLESARMLHLLKPYARQIKPGAPNSPILAGPPLKRFVEWTEGKGETYRPACQRTIAKADLKPYCLY